jgi:hypothetical protein
MGIDTTIKTNINACNNFMLENNKDTHTITNRNLNHIQDKALGKGDNKKSKDQYDTDDLLKVFHQNIRGLRNKIMEMGVGSMKEDPHIICFTEHHLNKEEINSTNLPGYNLGARFCRSKLKNGGCCIYIKESCTYSRINLEAYAKEQDIEICAIQIKARNKCHNFMYI